MSAVPVGTTPSFAPARTASAANADPELGAYGTAKLNDVRYQLRIPDGARKVLELQKCLESVTRTAIVTYCTTRDIAPRAFAVRPYANRSTDALTLTCTLR